MLSLHLQNCFPAFVILSSVISTITFYHLILPYILRIMNKTLSSEILAWQTCNFLTFLNDWLETQVQVTGYRLQVKG